VHGTGVRSEGYRRSLDAIAVGCDAAGLGEIHLEGVPWGEKLGTRPDLVDETLPAPAARAALGAPLESKDEAAAHWELLLDDPLFELRVAGAGSDAPAEGFAVGRLPPDQALLEQVGSAADAPAPSALGPAGISEQELAEAVEAVAGSEELRNAARAATSAGGNSGDFAEAAASAIVAYVLAEYETAPPGEAPPAAYSAPLREDLVKELANRIVPETDRGLGGWIGRKMGGFVAGRATKAFQARREKYAVGSLPFLGDILYYQKRGDAIRDMVAEAIAKAPQPVVALGHSLGGIVLVDLLTREDPPEVARLVTAGSQSPLFYAIDALDRMRREASGPKPPPYTPWLNIYDRADFLSFVAKQVFPGISAIEDAEISSGVPFPSAHSAYFHQPETFELIRNHWPP
jgi:hypothetical protein